MSDEEDVERVFAPHARYAALRNPPGPRWHDPETGQEYWRRNVGVDDLLEAGARLDEPDAVRLASLVEIAPYQPSSGQWVAKISRRQLDVRRDDEDAVRFVTRKGYVESETFDEHAKAVEWVEIAVDAFEDAARRDAREWRRERRETDDGEREE